MSNGGAPSSSAATPEDFDDHGDTVTVFQHEGDGENTEHLQSMDLHDVKTALEKDAELDEPGSVGKAATSPTTAGNSRLQPSTIRPIIQPMLYANGFMVPPFAAGTPIYAGIRPIKMEGGDWKVSQASAVTGIPYGYPAAGFLPVDQSGLRPAAGYPFMIPGQYAVAAPYQQFLGHQQAPNAAVQPNSGLVQPQVKEKKPHIKKPLNAFMIFMKTKRAEVIKECTLKESAAINQILGKMWHALDRSEQAKYYEMAREERARHMQMYPGWSARDNYAIHKKRRKRKAKTDKSEQGEGTTESCALAENDGEGCPVKHPDSPGKWCGPCKTKKKCTTKQKEDPEKEVIGTPNGTKVTSVVGTIGQDRVDDSTFECGKDVITSETNQSEKNIIQAPITLQTIPT